MHILINLYININYNDQVKEDEMAGHVARRGRIGMHKMLKVLE
jgi:hypothetical protein